MKKNGIILNDIRRRLTLHRTYPHSILYFHTFLVFNMVKNGRSLSRLKDVNINIQSYLTMEDNINKYVMNRTASMNLFDDLHK